MSDGLDDLAWPALVTGATGFLGGAVVRRLAHEHPPVVAAVRRACPPIAGVRCVQVPDCGPDTDWSAALDGVRTVIHCAARVHVLHETDADPLAAFRRVNLQGTLRLAEMAAAAGVRRFVFVSTIGINGAETFDRPFGPDDPVAPNSPYAQSKWEAEQALRQLAASTGLEVAIIRPTLIYGPHAPGNFAQLVALVRRGWPLPLGGLHNRRSFVALDNVVDLIVTCAEHPAAANQVFLVSDGADVSTTEFVRMIGAGLGRRPRLLPLPAGLLRRLARMVGREVQVAKVTGSLHVDIAKTRRLLGWSPVVTTAQAVAAAVRSR